MSLEALQSGRIQYASKDGSREFISLLACISANGTALPPALIYKGDSLSLQDTFYVFPQLERCVPTESRTRLAHGSVDLAANRYTDQSTDPHATCSSYIPNTSTLEQQAQETSENYPVAAQATKRRKHRRL